MFPNQWTPIKLYELAEWINGKAFKKDDYNITGLPVIKIAELNTGLSSNTKYSINNDVKFYIKKGDILFAWSGNPDTSIDTHKFKEKEGYLNQHIFKVLPNDNKIESDFLYYILKYLKPFFKEIARNKQTTGLGHVTISDLKKIQVRIPSKNIQKKISDIFVILDKKIEINNEIISNLESQAQAIFKSWFVDFEPFQDGDFVESELGMIPEGWEVKELGEVADCKLGGTPSRKKREFWDGDIPWINSGEVNKDRIIEPSEYITEEGLKKSATKLLKRKTTLVAITGATLGQVSLLEIDCCTNQSIIGIEPNEKIPYEYIYLFIKNNINKIISNQTGAAQQHINLNDIRTSKIIIPQNRIMKEYVKIVSLLMLKVEKNYFENTKLAELRDALLPKLMAGEIDVSNIKIDGEEVKNE